MTTTSVVEDDKQGHKAIDIEMKEKIYSGELQQDNNFLTNTLVGIFQQFFN